MTFDRELNCLAGSAAEAKALHAVRPAGLTEFLATLRPEQGRFLTGSGFAAAAQDLRLLPGGDGLEAAVLGLGEDRSPYAFGDLALRLPEGTDWRLRRATTNRTTPPWASASALTSIRHSKRQSGSRRGWSFRRANPTPCRRPAPPGWCAT